MKNPCCSCEYRGDLFKLGKGGIPHCHCHHPSIPPDKFGWDTLQEAFWTCDKFKRRQKSVENRQADAQQAKHKIKPALCEGMPHGSYKCDTMCDPNNSCFKSA